MTFCPNKSLPEWKALEESQPTKAYYLWNKYKGEVPSKYYFPKESDKRDRAVAYLSKMFPGKEVVFYDFAKEIGNKTQHGYIENGAINLWTSAQSGTEYHEAYHLLFRTMLSEEQRDNLYKDATKQFGAPTTAEIQKIQQEVQGLYDIVIGEEEARKLVLEEKMADGFMEHMKTEEESSKGMLDRLAKWFRDLFSWIKGIASDKLSLRDVYSLMETTKANDTFLGRGVFRNPQAMQSSYNPSMLVEGIPSATVEKMVQGLTNMAIDEIESWDTPDVNKILGSKKNKTNGSIVNGLLYQIYDIKGKTTIDKTDIPKMYKMLALETRHTNAKTKYNTLKRQDSKAAEAFKPEVDGYLADLVEYAKKNGIVIKKKVINPDSSDRDKAIAQRQIIRRKQVINVITNWYGKTDPETGNTLVPSWRQMVLNGLAANQYSVTKDIITVDNKEGDTENDKIEAQDAGADEKDIKGRSHFADSPMSKLSQRAKNLLRRIPIVNPVKEGNKIVYKNKKNEVFTNMNEYHTLPFIYKQLSELWADTLTFEEMEAKLIEQSKHRTDIKSINARVASMSEDDRATLYNAFANTNSQFKLILFGEDSKIINANSSTTENRVAKQWRNQIVEVGGQEEDTDITKRAVYIKTFGDDESSATFKIKSEKFKLISKYFQKSYEASTREFKDDTVADSAFMSGPEGQISAPVQALGSLVWHLGMSLGSNIQEFDTIQNLQSLVDKGFTVIKSETDKRKKIEVKGKAAFNLIFERARLVETFKSLSPTTTFSRSGLSIGEMNERPIPYYDADFAKKGMKFLASLAPFFTSRSAESFVTAVNTATFPLNMATPIAELPTIIKADLAKNKERALELYKKDPFIFPPGMEPSHLFNHLQNNQKFAEEFSVDPLSAIRDYAEDALEYEDFNSVDSILSRIQAFVNNEDATTYGVTVPSMGDRAIMLFMIMPRLSGHGKDSLNMTYQQAFIKGILQDLLRIKEAKKTIGDPNATKIPDYHTGPTTGLSSEFMQFDGITKDGERIVTDVFISEKGGGMFMSDLAEDYINAVNKGIPLNPQLKEFANELTRMTADLTLFYQDAAIQIAKLIEESGRKKDLSTKQLSKWAEGTKIVNSSDNSKFVQLATPLLVDFLIHEDVGRNEIIKITRGNRAMFKSIEDFTKRQRTLGTPGTKLAEKGTLGKKESQKLTWLDDPMGYGAISQYEELVFDDPMGQITSVISQKMDEWAVRTATQLIQSGYTPEEAAFTAQYMAGEFEEHDGLTLISIDWLREIMEGQGEWKEYHEQAYKNYKQDPEGRFLYPAGVKLPKGAKVGQEIPFRPYKPFGNEVKRIGNTVASDITKTAYFPILKSYTKAFPIMDDMRMRMEANPLEANNPYAGMKKIHTASAVSAKKGVKLNILDIKNWSPRAGGFFANVKSNRNSTSALRFPQSIPPAKEKSETIFGRQVKKNAIANVVSSATYFYNAGLKEETAVFGEDMTALYHAAIEERIKRDLESVNNQIGLGQFRKVVEKLKLETSTNSKVNIDAIQNAQEFKEAKKKLIKNIRSLIESQAIERELSDNFIKALDITIDPVTGITRFSIPLDFPVYGTAFQTALLSIYNNNVFKQYVSGYEAVQTAALGGFETNNSLNFLEIVNHASNKTRGTRLAHAEIMVREDVLRKFGIEPGVDLDAANIPEELRRIIGYRIPNQDKASTIIFKIKAILPAGYEKAVVVPPQLVKLMGSDFDVDKMFLMFPEIENGEKVKPNYNELWRTKDVSKVSDKELMNVILDTIEAVFSSPEHYLETLRPLDDEVLKDIRTSIVSLNESLKPNKVFTGGMYETQSAVRNLLGNKMRGLWANAMAGRNVAAASDNFNLMSEFAIKIQGELMNTKFLKAIPKDAGYKYDSGLTTDRISSRYVTAAVDGTKAPYHYIVNDNPITFPVELLWVHYHGDTELLHHFLNQPIIRDFVDIMANEHNDDLSKVNVAYKKVAEKYNITLGSVGLPDNYKKIPSTYTMSREAIMTLTVPSARALQNFMKMYTAGKQLKEAFKLLTPDTMSGINRIEAVQSYVERKQKFDNPKGGLIDNSPIAFYGRAKDQNVLTQFYDADSIYGFERGYYNLLVEMLGVAGTVFPMTTSESAIKFKEAIKTATGRDSLSVEQHRDINAAMMFTVLTRQDSPLSVYFNVPYSEDLYKPGKGKFTLWARVQNALQKYANLSGNEFLSKLSEDDNNKSVKGFTTFNFDATQQYAPEEKSRIQEDLYNLMYRPEAYLTKPGKGATEQAIQKYKGSIEEIKKIGFDLCMHTLISNGFRKSAFNYATMIPPQFWLQPLKREMAGLPDISVAEYLHKQSMNMQTGNYFTAEDLVKFFRIFGEIRPGGSNLTDRQTLGDTVPKLAKEHYTNVEKYGGYPPAVMVFRTQKGESGVYVLSPNYKQGSDKAVYLSLNKTANKKKHIVGGEYLNIKVVGKETSIDSILPFFKGLYIAGAKKVDPADVTQICML
jgi:hypothetical protein